MMRSLLTVIAGLFSGMFASRIVQWLGASVSPPRAELQSGEIEALKQWVASAPPSFFAMLLVSWAVGALVGGLVAGLLAPSRRELHALAVGAIQAALAGFQLAAIPHPTWVVVLGLTLFVPLAWLGGRPFRSAPDAPPA